MENNGVGTVDGSRLRDKEVVENEVLESKVDEITVGGSDESRDSEGDEVFEEATNADILRIDSENAVKNGNLGDSLEVDVNLDAGHETEKFEEATEIPEVVSHEGEEPLTVSHEKIEEFIDQKDVDKVKVAGIIDEHSVPEEVVRDVVTLMENDGLVDSLKDEVREVPDLGTACDIVLEGGVVANEKAGIEKSQDGFPVSDNLNLNGPVVIETFDTGAANNQESQSHAEFKSSDANEVEGGESDSQWKASESNGEILLQIDKNLELNETSGLSNTEAQDDKKGNMDDVSDGLCYDQQADKVEESLDLGTADEIVLEDGNVVNQKTGVVLQKWQNGVPFSNILNLEGSVVEEISDNGAANKKEPLVNEKLESRDANGFEGVEADSRKQDTESNGEILHQNDKNVELNDTSSIFDTENQDDKNGDLENFSAGLHSEQQVDKVEGAGDKLTNLDMELKTDSTRKLKEAASAILGPGHTDTKVDEHTETPNKLGLEDQDNRSQLKVTSAPAESNHHEESSKLDDNLHNTSVEESTITQEVGRSPFSEVSAVKKEETVEGVSSDVVAEKSEDSQSRVKNVSVVVSNYVVGKLERQTTIDEEVKLSTGGIRESEIRPLTDVPSSTKSTDPAIIPSSTLSRPAGLGRAAPLLEPSPRVVQQPRVNGTVPQMQNQVIEDPTNGEAEENDETREKLQMIRVKFLRLAHRLGQTPHNVVVAQVLYRLGLAEQLRGGNGGRVAAFSYDRASAMAEQLEAAGQEPLDFTCTIMVLGKTGVGKSATINSIFDQVKFSTDAFQLGTKKVQDVVGTVQGIKVRVIDTPGLLPSWSDQHRNEKILHSVKRFIKKSPPDIVLYLDRLDMQSRDSGDMPLLRTITDTFGPSIWFNAIVVLTHAASAPPEGPNGVATSYDMFVTQRSHVVQQAIRQAAGDMRLMNPVSLVENHSACRTNRAGQRVLPNGQVWKPHLLLLSFASKILAEANTLLKLQDAPPGKPFTARVRAPPLPFLLTSLLRSRPQLKLPHEQFGDDDDTLDADLDESTDSDDESEYDELPPFKQLTRAQLAKLTRAQKKAYYDELEYREKLYMRKQLNEEKQRRRLMKKMAAEAKDLPNDYSEGVEEESGVEAYVPTPMADLPLPASFDSDNPTHRYRCLENANQWLVRPVLDSHSWDHDVGYEGVNMERSFVIKDKIPMSFSGQVTKDKKEAHFQMEVAGTAKHNEGKSTTLGFDMQQIGKDIAYTIRSDTKFSNFRRNKGTASLSVSHMGDAITGGVKVEDKLIVSRQGQVVMSGGAIVGRGDVAYGGSLEATLRDKDYPLGRSLTTMSLSVMDWHGDLATGWNAQTQIPVGRFTNLIGSVNFNNRGQGQVSIRMNSSEQLQIALVALIPLLGKILGYAQQTQFGY